MERPRKGSGKAKERQWKGQRKGGGKVEDRQCHAVEGHGKAAKGSGKAKERQWKCQNKGGGKVKGRHSIVHSLTGCNEHA